EKAAKIGAQQIVITDSQSSPLASFSDVCFVVREAQVSSFRFQSTALYLVQSLTMALAYQQGNAVDDAF
ncbi:Fe-S cluster assembly protein HesB, partial [Xenorhabdus bovienii]|nr:Fe-S cluster assembly protein HesB [Xenorhabdus bovienii]